MAKTILKWILFLPVALLFTIILQSGLVYIFILAKHTGFFTLNPSFWNILGWIAFKIPIILFIIGAWCSLVVWSPILACNKVAPNPQVSSVIYGTVFVILEFFTVINLAHRGFGIWTMVYQVVFSCLLIFGIWLSYHGIFHKSIQES